MITNPMNGFEFKCGDTQSCQNANFHIELNQDISRTTSITNFKGFIMGGENSAKDANIVINNDQGMDANGDVIVLNIEFIECSGNTACEGTTFVTDANVNIASVKCAFGACVGCLIKETLADAGIACDPSQRTTATPGNISPIIELPGGLPAPLSTTKSPPLNIVLPPLPGMNPVPATPSTTTVNIITLPTQPVVTVPATTAKVIELPPLPPLIGSTSTSTTTTTTTAAPITIPSIPINPAPVTPITPLSTASTSTTTTTTTTTKPPVSGPMIPVNPGPVTPATTATNVAPATTVGNGQIPRYVPI